MLIPTGYLEMLLEGMLVTVHLSLGALLLAVVLGMVMASAKLSRSRFLVTVATLYTTVLRSIPDLVQLLLVFFSLQIWLNSLTDELGIRQINIEPFTAGILALGLIYGAYFTETFRGAFLSVPLGQIEAGNAYGLTGWQTFRLIRFPQMMRFALPGIANNWLVLVKSTALVSIIGLSDLTSAAQDAGRGSGNMLLYLCLAGGFYLAVTSISGIVVHLLQKRYSAGVREAEL
jgi:histidine transport system permease protein